MTGEQSDILDMMQTTDSVLKWLVARHKVTLKQHKITRSVAHKTLPTHPYYTIAYLHSVTNNTRDRRSIVGALATVGSSLLTSGFIKYSD